jgi:phosphoribosylaminoimidazole (AIR) synthetase
MLKPTGYGAIIDESLEPAKIMLIAQELGNVADREAYNTWNMGPGGVAPTPEPEKVIKVAAKYGIEAKVIGEVVAEPGILITSTGYRNPGQILEF